MAAMNKGTVELLEKHFDIAFTAPDGIKKLRELILSLAMQGKLVEQDPKDQPAGELLQEIEAEKRRLVKASKIKAPKTLPEIKADEVPYALPKGWEWVRLGDISEINGGFAFKSSRYIEDGVRVIRISDFDERGFKDGKVVRYSYSDELKPYLLETNNILMAMTGGTVGKSFLVKDLPESMVVNQRVATIKINARVIPAFVNNVVQTDLVQGVIQDAKNSTNDNISMSDIKGFFTPLPPLPEQQRIVARIDQLMARCDELAKLRAEHEQKRLAVHTAALNRLLAAQERDSFAEAWQFITRHFGQLYSIKENVAELRKTILQLAVMGKLVPQDPNDPPASALLKEIEAEKQQLVKEGKIKKAKPLPEIKPEETPYMLPESWEWARFNDVLDVRDGTHDTPKYVEIGYPLITSKNLYTGKLSFEDVKFISEEDHKKICERSAVDVGDILFAMIGSIGNPVIVDCEDEFSIKNVALFKFYIAGKPDKRYLHYFLSLGQENMKATSSGAVQSFVSLGFLRSYLYPLPPLPEQQRIVAKIDQLMALCDHLEQQIDATTANQSALLNALMAIV